MKQTEKIVPEDWIMHLGGANRESIGQIALHGKGLVTIDLLDRERNGMVDWFEVGETLDELGTRYLVTLYELAIDSGISKVYITEVTPGFVRIKEDDFNDINSDQTFYTLPFPAPEELLRELPGR